MTFVRPVAPAEPEAGSAGPLGSPDNPVSRNDSLRPADDEAPRPYVADLAASDPALTRYDEEHLITYLRLLDANADGVGWRDVSWIVLHVDAEREPDRARRACDSHLARAKWMTEVG